MVYYRAKYFGVEASVDAVNRASAEAQLEGLFTDRTPCFCLACREGYCKDYSITILQGYEPVTSCTKDQQVSSVRFI
jgi:hypothetical protein